MKPILFTLPGNDKFAATLKRQFECQEGEFTMRSFPDGETYLRINSNVKDREVILLDTLVNPDNKTLPLLFLATTAKEQGASRVGLLAPYLAYMRQDISFQTGESVTTKHYAHLLSTYLDWLITVDPHLHRIRSLNEIFSIPNGLVHSAPLIANWIVAQVNNPLILGPDSESKQWVAEVAMLAKAPHAVFSKRRLGDRKVILEMADISSHKGCTPVLVDDIISTGTTMIKTIKLLTDKFIHKPVCIGIHGIFCGEAFDDLIEAGTVRVVTTNTILHPTNDIDVTPQVIPEIEKMLTIQSIDRN